MNILSLAFRYQNQNALTFIQAREKISVNEKQPRTLWKAIKYQMNNLNTQNVHLWQRVSTMIDETVEGKNGFPSFASRY